MNNNADLLDLPDLLGRAGIHFEVVYDGDTARCPCNTASHPAAPDSDRPVAA